jgi:putative tricarboxylic transport membrane protein
MVGMDPVRGLPRFTFGQMELMDGIGFVPIIMGLFGMAEILENAEKPFAQTVLARMSSLMPGRQEIRDSAGPIVRGSILGTLLGLVPGLTGSASSFLSYIAEKKLSAHPERFGTGMIAGVAGPETANNAHANGALIPLFTLGIPASPTVAVIMGAFMMHGLVPGPFLFKEHADVAWGVIASFYVGNLILLVMNLPMIPLWVSFLRIPIPTLYTLILGFCVIGSYCAENSVFEVGLTLFFGLVGYAFKKLDIPLAPIILTVILGPLMERALRQSLEMSRGDFTIFFTRPISAALLGIAAVFVITSLMKMASQMKEDHVV